MRKSTIIGLILLAFCLVCRWFTPVADFYAAYCYPWISAGLSLPASLVPFSLEELVVLGFAAGFLIVLIMAIRKKKGFFHWLSRTAVLAMWLYVWFYMGWGNNYYRTGFYQRNGVRRVAFEEKTFQRFLEDYSRELNLAAAQAGSYDKTAMEADIKRFYTNNSATSGYTRLYGWQHPKKPLLNRLYSAVGVHGFIGPFFCEPQVNLELLEHEYPYTTAHELAHLSGVTSEAEASYWGFTYCRESEDPAVRYSGYISIMPHVLYNAYALLPEETCTAWAATLCDKAREDYSRSREYWAGRRVEWIDKAQTWFYNLYLKSNGVSEGIRDYSGVVGMIMTMDSFNQQQHEEL